MREDLHQIWDPDKIKDKLMSQIILCYLMQYQN